jgi:asparagine synthase (glutamine-hydrolysing)
MCGIFGFWLKRPLSPEDIASGRAALNQLNHRGPDASGVWTDAAQGIFLGHTRLAIVDLSPENNQPLISTTTPPHVLVFNGEVYNYRTLRAELKTAGFTFHTEGDTEVLLQGWRYWQTTLLERLDGMYAFALYDGSTVHLATDPFGEKPLYWAQTPEGFYFASEPAVLTRYLNLSTQLTDTEVASFLALGFIAGEGTGYRGLQRAQPATYLGVRFAKLVAKRTTWQLPPLTIGRGPIRPLTEKALDTLRDALIEALRVRVHADVPVGLFLSSGIDSSLMAALLAKELRVPVQTLTVAFPDGRNEAPQARAIAEALGLPHTTIDSRADTEATDPQALLDLYGEPNDNLTAFAVRQMSALARTHFKVALTGTGGDELGFGYGRYAQLHTARFYFNGPQPMRSALAHLSRPWVQHVRACRWLHHYGSADPADASLAIALRNYPVLPWLQQLPGFAELIQCLTQSTPPLATDRVTDLRCFDTIVTLPQSYIPAIERGSMRSALEVRTPFLQRALWEQVSRLDQRSLYAFGTKQALRRLVARYLPKALLERPKQGFVFPYARFLRGCSLPNPLPGVPAQALRLLRENSLQHGWQKLAARAIILDTFLNRSTQPKTSDDRNQRIDPTPRPCVPAVP